MRADSLWKLSVVISLEAEEAVTELLEQIFGQPASVFADARTGGTIASVYLTKRADCSTAKRAVLRTGLERIKKCGLGGSGRISVANIRRENWAESWKRHFKPITIGSALLLKPSWSRRRPKKDQAVVVLDPGLSFGTGHHPTTRFCLEQLVTVQKAGHARSFLDIGTGSGILAIAAAKLGFRPITAMDSDPEAVRIARANAKQNRAGQKLRLVCRDLATLSVDGVEKYDLVCANLIFDLLLAEKGRILGRLNSGGTLVLAGILRSQFAQVRAAYEESGLRLAGFKAENEWASGAFVWSQRARP